MRTSIVAGIGVLTYANSLSGPFIFDDRATIETNPYVRHLWPLTLAMQAPPETTASGRPLISLSLAINYALGGLDVRGYHALNIAVHILAALVLFGIVRRTFLGDTLRPRFGQAAHGLALGCTLLWLVHPLHTECINYVTARTESIMGLFYLLTLYCAIRAHNADRRLWWSVASVLCCILGMASKEAMATAPMMVMLYDVVFGFDSIPHAWRKRWRLYAGLMATWILLAVLHWSSPRSDSVGFDLGVSAWDYMLNQCMVIVHYLRLAFWPHPLVPDYGFPKPISIRVVAPYAMVVLALLTATGAALVYRPMIGFLGTWFFLILGPTSSFVPIVTEVAAERRMYLPLAGLIVLVVVTGYTVLERVGKRVRKPQKPARGATTARFERRVAPSVVSVVLALLIWTTVQRNTDYRSRVSIWQTAVRAVPTNARAQYSLGYALQSEGRLDEASGHYRQALRLKPNYAKAHINLGMILNSQGETGQAIRHYRWVLRIDPDHARAHFNLGNALQSQGKVEEAIDHYRQALRIQPDWAIAHNNLGSALSAQGKLNEAIDHYRQALQLKPDYARGHNNLGNVLSAQGKVEEAIDHYRQALQIQPDYAKAHYMLGAILHKIGQPDEALKHMRLFERYRAKPGHTAGSQRR